jgi:hypothetical protein
LVAIDAGVEQIIRINNLLSTDKVTELVGTLPFTMDVGPLFSGGKGDKTYTAAKKTYETAPNALSDTFVAAIAKDTSTLTITKKTGVTSPVEESGGQDDYTFGAVYTVTATDANKSTATKDVRIIANRKPVARDALTLRVGTQNTPDAGRKAGAEIKCATFDVCALIPVVGIMRAGNDVDFADDVIDDEDAATTELLPKLTYSVVKVSRDAAAVAVSASADGKMIMVTGKVATDNGDTKMDNDPTTVIVVRATDEKGEYVDTDLTVTVDGRPTVKTPFQSSYEVTQGAEIQGFITGVLGFFMDVESTLEMVDADEKTTGDQMVFSSDENIVTGTIEGNGGMDITPHNVGTATITVRAQESDSPGQGKVAGLGQWREQSFMIVVKAAPRG